MILVNLLVVMLLSLGWLAYAQSSSEASTAMPESGTPLLAPIPEAPTETQWGMDPTVRRIYLSMVPASKTPLLAPNGGFFIASVESYDVDIEGVSSCSFIARKNILQLLDSISVDPSWMAQGDANDLIRFGRLNKTLTAFTDKQAFLDALDKRHQENFETVFDVYRHVPTRSYALQGHRAAVFLGEDSEWYILDPLDGTKTREPQLLKTYLANDVAEAEWFGRFPGYTRVNPLELEHFVSMLSFLSDELELLFQNNLVATVVSQETDAHPQQVVELLLTEVA